MIYSPPAHSYVQYRPSYGEIADEHVYAEYRKTEAALIESRESSEYVSRKIARIQADGMLNRLRGLRVNWDTYGADPPSMQALQIADTLIDASIGFGLLPDAIVPSGEGGVAICFARNGKYADIECLNSGEILAVRYSREENPHAWPVEPNPIATEATIGTISAYFSA